MESEQILLRLSCVGDTITSAVSSEPDSTISDLEGLSLSDLLRSTGQEGRYILTELSLLEQSITCAVRKEDSRTTLVYYLRDGSVCPAGLSVPVVKLTPGSPLPLVSPGMVALLGYTPWELAQSDLLEKLVCRSPGEPVNMTLTDRWGSSRTLVCTVYPSGKGDIDIFFMPVLSDSGSSLHSLIGRWEQMPLSSPYELLSFLLDALGTSQGAVLTSENGKIRVLASKELELDPDDPEQQNLIDIIGTSGPVWLDAGTVLHPSLGDGQALIYPFGRNRAYIFLVPFQEEAGRFHEKIEVLLPVMSMRLDLWELSSGKKENGDDQTENLDTSDQVRHSMPSCSSVSVYSKEGFIINWSQWMENATGIDTSRAINQQVERLIERIGSLKVSEQLGQALRETCFDEPIEFMFRGNRCFSYISTGQDDLNLYHTILDTGDLGIHAVSLMAGPGTFAPAGNPASVAEALAEAIRITNWEYDMSTDAAISDTHSWLSHRTTLDLLVHIMRLLAPFCPDRWIGLSTEYIEKSVDPLFLQGQYHVLRFRILPMLLPSQVILLEHLMLQIKGLGCRMTHSEVDESIRLAIPAAVTTAGDIDLAVYSSDDGFLEMCAVVLPSAAGNWRIADSLESMVELQETSQALVLRLAPAQLPIVSTFVMRLPAQPLLVVSGQRTALPFLGCRVGLQQLPVDKKHLLSALRRIQRQ